MHPQIADKIARFPEGPGVYVFTDRAGRPLYVGKAANLRARARAYLRPGGDGRIFLRLLEREAHDVEFLATRTEQEALLLENTVIKKRRPRCNVRLKDDKAFLLLRLQRRDAWPWFRLVRRRQDDGALYFGPYASARAVRQTLRLLHKIVPLRDCSDAVFRNRSRPCIKHQIGRCPAPCVQLIERAAYDQLLDQAVDILRGEVGGVLRRLRAAMTAAAAALAFERAQVLKAQIEGLSRVAERQSVVATRGDDADALGLHRTGNDVTAVFLLFRGGQLEGSRRFTFRSPLPDDLLLAELLGRFYEGDQYVPSTILVPSEIDAIDIVRTWLAAKRAGPVEIAVPQRGSRRRQLELAIDNARLADAVAADATARRRAAAAALAEMLGLDTVPQRIHCLDVSTIQGTSTVASRVAFADGVPDKNSYRRFRIGTGAAGNDFAAMDEAVRRSLTHCLAHDDDEPPDLLLVDGGKGQLSAARRAVDELGLRDDVKLAGLAKSRWHGHGDLRHASAERLFVPGRAEPIALAEGAPATLLVAHLRDEAHRFAITYHRKVRGALTSVLDQITGVGPTRRRILLRRFGSLRGVAAASLEELRAVPGLPDTVAEAVFTQLHRAPGAPS